MKGIIISSNHTVTIDGFQIDMWYNFERSHLEIYVNGELTTQGNFTPSFKTFNYINLMDVAATTLEKFKKVQREREKERLKELESWASQKQVTKNPKQYETPQKKQQPNRLRKN